MTLKKLHFLSGIIITLFVSLHLFNHLISVLSVQKHIDVMDTLRPFYRNIFSEIILMIAVLIQIISGLKLFKTGRKIAASNNDKLQLWSGFYLSMFFVIHLSAIFVGRILLHLDTNVYFGVAGLNTFPFNIFFIPYYALAIFSFFGHIAAIHRKKMKAIIFGLNSCSQSKAILIFGVLLTLVIFCGLTNHFNGVSIPADYNILIGK